MEGKCPFCGRGLVQDYGPPRFDCGSVVGSSRSAACYEAELTTLKELLQRVVDSFKEISDGKGPYSRDRLEHASNTIEAMKDVANAFLTIPEVVKAMEEKQ